MDTRRIRTGLLAIAASGCLMFTACNKEEKDKGETAGSTKHAESEDRAGTASERDTAFEESFYGPPGSDWRFTPGTGLYDFEKQGKGGAGSDSGNH